MTTRSVSSVVIMDTSNSMNVYGYEAITIIDSKAFVSQFQPNDWIGVVQYQDNASTVYDIAQVTATNSVLEDATKAIQALSGHFDGSCTNIGGGIESGTSMLKKSSPPWGLVLLTDGYHNCGTDPLDVLPHDMPIYACAMGPNSDENLLKEIASRTGGTYYYAPYVTDMMKIYNEIQSQAPNTQVVANQLDSIEPIDYKLIPAVVSAGNHTGQFSVVWTDAELIYTDDPPTGNQFRLSVVDPNLDVVKQPPSIIGDGYAIYNLPNPMPGQWYIQVEYAGGAKDLKITSGAFEIHESGSSPIQMEVIAPKEIQAGQPLNFQARVTDGNDPIEDLKVVAEIASPKIGIPNALKLYQDQIAGIKLTEGQKDTEEREEIAKLRFLHRKLRPQVDLLPTIVYPTYLQPGDNRNYVGAVRNTTESGSYNIQVKVTGYAKKSGTPFQRTQLVSVIVA